MSNKETLLEEKPDWRFWAKIVVAFAVAATTTASHADGAPLWLPALRDGVIAVGVILGIGSTGLFRR